jgi:hypothetical protein
MKSIHYFIILLVTVISCDPASDSKQTRTADRPPALSEDKAEYLYEFAYHCIDQEYPNKTGHVTGDASDLSTPSEMHPAFYGCFDWHSAVHGHWTLVNLLIHYPDFEYRDEIIEKLSLNITKENILQEVAYFAGEHNKTFERTYGWVWLLKLAESLDQWNDPVADTLQSNLQPLTDLIENKLKEFLPKLTYPIRVGEHPNTAFALSFAIDYARSMDRPELESLIIHRAKDYYLSDLDCPVTWEPGGFDFLSPCLQEASLMGKVLSPEEYQEWMTNFLPEILQNPLHTLTPATVSDRSDGKMAHLDGLNFSRAWCLYEIGQALDNQALIQSANEHFEFSYDKISADEYAGAHWLASFALYALKTGNEH